MIEGERQEEINALANRLAPVLSLPVEVACVTAFVEPVPTTIGAPSGGAPRIGVLGDQVGVFFDGVDGSSSDEDLLAQAPKHPVFRVEPLGA